MTDQTPVNEATAAVALPAVADNKGTKEMLAMETGGELRPVVPRTLEEAFRYAQLIVKAGLAPASYEMVGVDGQKVPDPQKVVIGILQSLELGVAPMTGLRGIAIINGRPSIWGDLAIGLIQSKNLIQRVEQTYTGTEDADDYTAHYTAWRRGQESPYEGHFSVKDAKRAKLWLNPRRPPWIDYPKRMLMMRARAFALRDGFADALSGLAIREELEDLPPEPKPVALEFLNDAVENSGALSTQQDQTAKAS